jgi:hypothetical protein
LDMADSAVPARGEVCENHSTRGDADEVDYQQESKSGNDEIGDDGFGPGIFLSPLHTLHQFLILVICRVDLRDLQLFQRFGKSSMRELLQ